MRKLVRTAAVVVVLLVAIVAALFAFVAETPLANQRGRVTGFLQQARHGCVLQAERLRERVDVACVTAHAGVPGVQAGHQHAAAGSADGRAGVELGEAHSFRGHAIEMRGLNQLLPVAAQISVTQVIREDEDDVGLPVGRDEARGSQQAQRSNPSEQHSARMELRLRQPRQPIS